MKVLWVSNIVIDNDLKSSGSWIFSMAHAIMQRDDIVLGNIVPFKTKQAIQTDFLNLKQWRIPAIKNTGQTKLTKRNRNYILDIISIFKPDIIHIWGIENGYALITPYVNCPVLVEIQGINSEISKYYYGGLSFTERLKLFGIKEILTFTPPSVIVRKMRKMLEREKRIFSLNKYYTTPTNWMLANVKASKNDAVCFSNGFLLRNEFYESLKWKPNGKQILLTSASNVTPYKGLHVLLDALVVLKVAFPQIQLKIIGPFVNRGIRTNAYFYYLQNKIKKLGLTTNVVFLGSLNALQICEQINQSSVFINPSFIESAGLTILEAMAVGIPIVASYTGGIPSFSSGSVLYFHPGDYKMCAYQISQALTNKGIIETSGKMSRSYINKFHDRKNVVLSQLQIYKTILDENDIL